MTTGNLPGGVGAAPRRTPAILVILAWMVVGLPAAWGITFTVRSSIKLFAPPAAAPSPQGSSSTNATSSASASPTRSDTTPPSPATRGGGG